MQESTVTTRPLASPTGHVTMHWVPVVDSHGRARMEARWFDPGAAPVPSAARPAA